MFYGGDDEEMDFSSSAAGKTKLASLFDMDRAASQGGNESLKYTAPKEPKKRPDSGNQPSSSGPTSAVLCAGVAFAYKFKDKEYASEGKHGVAVIGNHANADYKMLLYITKEKPTAFARITSAFIFTVQPNNYVNFYDDNRQSWSLMFETENVLQQFAKQVALSKFFSVPSPKTDVLITQDLNAGEGQGLEIGDNIEIKYSSWQTENNAIGAVLETGQVFRFRIGKQKAIRAWDEGVVGMKKNSRRLLICTPSLATGGEFKSGKFPSSTPIVFEVEILRVKFSKERSEEPVVSSSAPGTIPTTIADDKENDREDSVRSKSKSISDQMAQPPAKPDKAKLISRMAKMGQPMLPVTVASHTDVSENESVSPNLNRPEVPFKPSHNVTSGNPVTNPYPISNANPVNVFPETVNIPPVVPPSVPIMMPGSAAAMMPGSTGQLSLYHSQVPLPYQAMMPQHHMVAASQPYGSLYPSQMYPTPPPPQPIVPPPVSQSAGDTSIPMMLMETRNQNTEVRVSLSRVSDKIDRISEKLDQLNSRQSNALTVASSMPSMEVGMLVHNIERIVMENERLKKENIEKSSRVEEQNIKINELLQRNQLYVEQSNAFLEQRSDSYKTTATQSQARVQAVEQEKVHLAMELSATTSQLASCQLELAAVKKREGELRQQLDRLVTTDVQGREEIGSMRLRLADQEQRLEQLGFQIKEEQHEKKLLLKQVESLKENLTDITTERDNFEKNLNDKKRKSLEEISKLESELKEIQTKHEVELESLKSRLKSERNSTESTTAQKLVEIEDDLNREWKEKCDRLISSAQEKHQREISEVINEKSWLLEKVESLETKLSEFKSLRSSLEQEKDSLQENLDQNLVWKDKYENLRAQATTMKDRYEQRLKDLEEERNAADEERERTEQERDKIIEKSRRLQVQLSSQASGVSGGTVNTKDAVVAEVKKIMNTVYRRLRQEFEPEESYNGSDIHAIVLNNVKAITVEMMKEKEESTAVVEKSVNQLEKPSVESALKSEKQDFDSPKIMEALPVVSEVSVKLEELPVPAETGEVQSTKEEPEQLNEKNQPPESVEQHLEIGRAIETKNDEDRKDTSGESPSGDFVGESSEKEEGAVIAEREIESDLGIESPVVPIVDGKISAENHAKESENGKSEENVSAPVTETEPEHMENPVDVSQNSSHPDADSENTLSTNTETSLNGTDPLQSGEPVEAKDADVVVRSAAAKDVPLFDDDETEEAGSTPKVVRKSPPANSKLFGDSDEDEDGLFSLSSSQSANEKKLSKTETKPRRNESDDDLAQKPPPMPLFGESDEEKDLDWLN